MKIKTVEIEGKTYAELREGKPVYVEDSGKEVAVDPPAMLSKIEELGREAKARRTKAEELEEKLSAFEGIEDAAAARKAMETVANLKDKDLIEAGEVERIKTEAIKAVEEKYKPTIAERDKLREALHSEKIGGAFARSKWLEENVAVPLPLIESTFSRNFEMDDAGNVIAKDANGNPIYSKERPGETANFEEAIASLVEQSAFRDEILKGRQKTGTGAKGDGGNGGRGGKKSISRADFDAMPPVERSAAIREGAVITE